ncbi:MAG: bifunctional hydroxymethylpyrimidine kinase/phosphomethylpyrimidine kinase [Kiloniellales bacterium]|nr:bifunctional hydroxymethylpyrimidine kinase/phosphomethylpyrimidine kinase [Kiloniellales bacterium]
MKGRVLIVAGSDSGGGAGIQADIKATTALGGFAATAIAALTAQNTRGVFGVVGIEPAFVQQQMTLVLEDIGADAIKTGMLAEPAIIEAVAEVLARPEVAPIPLVVDPVMVAQSGDALLSAGAERSLNERLVPKATLLTPNVPEAERLTGSPISDAATMEAAAVTLLQRGPKAVLLKGGHMAGEVLTDVLATAEGCERFESPRIATVHTHGTGCTLASAIATGLAQGLSIRDAVARGRDYLQAAIRHAPGFGHGAGPVDHLAGAPGLADEVLKS